MKFKEFLIQEKFLNADRMQQRWGGDTAYAQVHVNPDNAEVIEIIKDFKDTDPDQYKKNAEMEFVRGIFDTKGKLYVWWGSFFHDPIIKKFKIKNPSNFRFSWNKEYPKTIGVEDGDLKDYFKIKTDDKVSPEIKEKMKERLKIAFPAYEEIGSPHY